MEPIICIDRKSGRPFLEDVYGGRALQWLLRKPRLAAFLAKLPALSYLFALYQKGPWTKRAIAPFVKRFFLDADEFEKKLGEFSSFQDFFVRHLKPDARKIDGRARAAIIPADGRYRFFSKWELANGVFVKGKMFSLNNLLKSDSLAKKYQEGTVVIGRLAPPDYHRFHFAVSGVPSSPRLISGPLYSVNPWALSERIEILTENKRVITEIDSGHFGKVTTVEVGATHVGSIIETYAPGIPAEKGDEKGYFDFGGSLLILLFEKGAIRLDEDLETLSQGPFEIRCLMGQSLGQSLS